MQQSKLYIFDVFFFVKSCFYFIFIGRRVGCLALLMNLLTRVLRGEGRAPEMKMLVCMGRRTGKHVLFFAFLVTRPRWLAGSAVYNRKGTRPAWLPRVSQCKWGQDACCNSGAPLFFLILPLNLGVLRPLPKTDLGTNKTAKTGWENALA